MRFIILVVERIGEAERNQTLTVALRMERLC